MSRQKKNAAEQVRDLVTKAEKIVKKIATERDKLRAVIGDLEQIEYDASDAIEDMESGIRFLEDGAESLSEQL